MLRKLFGRDHNGDHYAQVGLPAFDRRRYRLAARQFKKATELGVEEYDLAETYILLGRSYYLLAQYRQAISAYKKAIDLNPNSYQAWNNLGILYMDIQEIQESEKCYQTALKIQPGYPFALASLAAVYIRKNQPGKAIELLEKSLQSAPGMATAYANLALAYGMVHRFADADKSLKQAIALGYENWYEVQERIVNLKNIAEQRATLGEWLPAICPRCGAPISAATVIWRSRSVADCSYCGVNLPGALTPKETD